jgi:hypothetical protein
MRLNKHRELPIVAYDWNRYRSHTRMVYFTDWTINSMMKGNIKNSEINNMLKDINMKIKNE